MQKPLVFGIAGLVVGLFLGFWGANSINRTSSLSAAPAGSGTVPFNGIANGGNMPDADIQEVLDQAQNEPKNFAVQMRTGDMYAQIGRFAEAAEFYKRGLAVRPEDRQGNLVLANAYFDARMFKEAVEQYRKVLSLTPDDNNARADLAGSLIEADPPDYDAAIVEVETVLKADPKHEASLYYLGIALSRKGEKEKAAEALKRLEEANPANPLITRLRQNIES